MRNAQGRLPAPKGSVRRDRSGCAGVCGTGSCGCCTPRCPAPCAPSSAPARHPQSDCVGKRPERQGPTRPAGHRGCAVLLQSGDSALSAAAAPHAASPARRVRGRPRRGRPGGPGRVGPGGEGRRRQCPPIARRTPQVQRSAGPPEAAWPVRELALRLSAVSSPPPEAGPGAMR